MFEQVTYLTFGVTVASSMFIGMVLGYQLKYIGDKKSDDIVPAGTKVRFMTRAGHYSYGIVLEDFVETKSKFIVVRNVEWKMNESSIEPHEGYRIFPIRIKEGVTLLGTGEWTTEDYLG